MYKNRIRTRIARKGSRRWWTEAGSTHRTMIEAIYHLGRFDAEEDTMVGIAEAMGCSGLGDFEVAEAVMCAGFYDGRAIAVLRDRGYENVASAMEQLNQQYDEERKLRSA